MPHALQSLLGAGGAAEPMKELPRFIFIPGGTEDENDFSFLPVLECDRDLHGRTWIESRAHPAGQPHAPQRRRVRQRAVPAEELRAVRSHGSRCLAAVNENDPVRKFWTVGVAGEQRTAYRVQLRNHMHERFVPQLA